MNESMTPYTLPASTALGAYTAYLNELIANKDPLFTSEYEPIIRTLPDRPRPFLSVVMRTQGKRPAMLREALDSLARQSDTDFEVVLVGHDLNDRQRELVQTICSAQSPDMAARIRLTELVGGNRTKPLNFGFAHTRGTYIAVLDDDDIVHTDWVSSFRQAADRAPGTMLHAYILEQDWTCTVAPDGTETLRPAADPADTFCVPFDMIRQLRHNRCPLHGLAFPAFVFRQWGIIFDERLTTYEDWDYLMRVAALVGVEDIPHPTAIYRKWVNAENAYTVHKREEWKLNYETVREKLLHMPILLPPGSADTISGASMETLSGDIHRFDTAKLEKSKLYVDRGNGFREQDSLLVPVHMAGEEFEVVFDFPKGETAPVSALRFDLTEEGMFAMSDVTCILRCADGTRSMYSLTEAQSSGIPMGNAILFPAEDPWVLWAAPGKPLTCVRITGKATAVLPADAFAVITARLNEAQQGGLLPKIVRKIKTLVKKLLGK